MRPRIRTIKPEVFTDERLWDLAEETGFPILQAFAGLWCFSDREGRFEWRPRALKHGILPYWEGDFSRVLDALVTRGFIRKYAVGTREYGLVRSFTRHQVVNNRESASEIPPPPDEACDSLEISSASTRGSRDKHATSTPLVPAHGEGKGTEGNGREESATDVAPTSKPSASPKPVSSGHVQEWSDILRQEFESRKRVAPKATHAQTLQLAQHCADLARVHGKTFFEAATKLAQAAADVKQGSASPQERFPFFLLALDPYAKAAVPTYVPTKLPPPNERV